MNLNPYIDDKKIVEEIINIFVKGAVEATLKLLPTTAKEFSNYAISIAQEYNDKVAEMESILKEV